MRVSCMLRVGSIQAACLTAVAAALVAAVPAAAGSGAPAPLKQVEAGTEVADILCNGDRALLISPGGTPACILTRSLDTLADRGWREGPAVGGPVASAAAQGGAASAPLPPHIHHNTLTFSKYPVVGEVAEMTFSVTHAAYGPGASGTDAQPARLEVWITPFSKSYRIFDVVSNIGTGDPGVFRPYDPDNVTTVARPGETYTVKAKFVIQEEGFVTIYGRGLHGEVIAGMGIAASKNVFMPIGEYKATGQTYLDRMMGAGAVHAAADSRAPAPLKQMEAGTEVADILCNGDRALLVSPGGTPACILARSLDTLADRGWQEGPAGGGGHDASAARQGGPERCWAIVAPRPPDTHHNTLTISKYPVVGEVAEMTFSVTTTSTVQMSEAYSAGLPLASLVVGIDPAPPTHRIFDAVSNIGTGDPGVFRPYDPGNVTTLARPGETYTVKAKFEVLEEGRVAVYGRGFDEDIASVDMMVSKNMSMSLDEYYTTGQAYLNHMMATCPEEEPPRVPEYDLGPAVPHWQVNRTTLLGEYHAMYSSFAKGYADLNYTEDQIVEELFYFGHLPGDIREFFVHIMNYTEERADAVRMGDDLLGYAYWSSSASIDKIVDDMLTRRNYTATEARDLLRDHMFYADDEAAALVLSATATRAQAGPAGRPASNSNGQVSPPRPGKRGGRTRPARVSGGRGSAPYAWPCPARYTTLNTATV